MLDDRWKWNGDVDKPTFGPAKPGDKFSFLSYSGGYTSTFWLLKRNGRFYGGNCAVDEEDRAVRYGNEETALSTAAARPDDNEGLGWGAVKRTRAVPRTTMCHVYVRDGMIQILKDSQRLGGKTLQLAEWDLSEYQR